MEAYFGALAAGVDRALEAGESYTLDFAAEATDFVRMNRGKVRQPVSTAVVGVAVWMPPASALRRRRPSLCRTETAGVCG